jgi:hypothetical protein
MKKDVKITFLATVDDKDIKEVQNTLDKFGVDIIGYEMPELDDIGMFRIEEI